MGRGGIFCHTGRHSRLWKGCFAIKVVILHAMWHIEKHIARREGRMKVEPKDAVYTGMATTSLLALSLAIIGWGVAPLSEQWLGDYHVLADFLLFLLVYGVLSGLLVRLLLRLNPLPNGEFSMDSPHFTRWKLLMMVSDFGRGALLPFTPIFMRPPVAMLFGATVGKNSALGGVMADPFMVSVGNGVILGNGSQVCGNFTTHDKITFGRVTIGDGATVGMNAIVMPGVEIGAGATVLLNSVVMPGTVIPAGEVWRGNPARKWQ